ncbi:hypothetical protein MN608_01347 [Microdochium nivale]|nr:hypothetical protein MN608_01347 [Microdochium nivale]
MFLNVPDDRQDHDTSIATQESDYERVPPRKIPSRWDKTLSPSKSSFRSPMKATTPGRVVAFSRSVVLPPPPPPPARVPELSEAESTAPPRPQNNTSKHVFLHPPPSLLQPPQIPDQSDQENDLRSKSAANTAASRSQPPRPGSVAAAAAPVASATKAAQLSRFPQPKAFALTGNTWTKSHWVRFDEILQLRRKNPRQFRRDHPNASIPGHAANDPVYCSDDDEGSNDEDAELHSFSTRNSSCRKILGKQVSSQGESMLVEPWHLEVVSAFMQELNPCPWDERVLVKRLFALIVGEERRKHASVRPSLTKGRGQADQRVELGTRHR